LSVLGASALLASRWGRAAATTATSRALAQAALQPPRRAAPLLARRVRGLVARVVILSLWYCMVVYCQYTCLRRASGSGPVFALVVVVFDHIHPTMHTCLRLAGWIKSSFTCLHIMMMSVSCQANGTQSESGDCVPCPGIVSLSVHSAPLQLHFKPHAERAATALLQSEISRGACRSSSTSK